MDKLGSTRWRLATTGFDPGSLPIPTRERRGGSAIERRRAVAGLAINTLGKSTASVDTRGSSSSSSSSSSSTASTFQAMGEHTGQGGTAGALAKPWSAGSEPDWSTYDAVNHASAVEHERDWGDVLGAWDEANEAHRAAYVPKKVYGTGGLTTMAQAGGAWRSRG